MLDFLRRNTQSLAVKIILGLIAVVFIFFMGGGGGLIGGAQNVAEVGDRSVTLSEFLDARQRTEQYYREQYGDQLTPELLQALDIPSTALNQLVDGIVLETEAERIGLSVPDEALRYEIREIESFRPNGEFSPTAYRNLLQRQGLTPSRFERNVRQQMLVEQLVDVVRQGVHVSEDDAFEQYRESADKMTLDYVKVNASDLKDTVAVDEAALATFFDENQESYRIGEGVKVRYLEYAPENFADASLVSDEDVETYYELNKETEFTIEEQVGARHILKKFPPGADDDAKQKARDAIDAVVARLDAGEDFAEVAKQESEDGSAASGGDLGTFGRGRMVKPFEDAAFALEVGATSGVVESPFGYHVIKVYSHEPGRVKPLDEVRAAITEKLAAENATDRVFDASADDALALSDGVKMDTLAEERGLKVKTTEVLHEGDTVEGVVPSTDFIAAALALREQGEASEPVHVGDKYYVMTLVERQDSRLPTLDEVRDKVTADFRSERAADAARAKADEVLAELRAGKTTADFEGRAGLEVGETQAFTRAGGFVGGIGNLPAAKEAAFKTENDGDVLPRTYTLRGDAFAFVRKSYEPATREDFEPLAASQVEALRRRREQQAVDEFVRSLKANMEIVYNQDLLKAYVR